MALPIDQERLREARSRFAEASDPEEEGRQKQVWLASLDDEYLYVELASIEMQRRQMTREIRALREEAARRLV